MQLVLHKWLIKDQSLWYRLHGVYRGQKQQQNGVVDLLG